MKPSRIFSILMCALCLVCLEAVIPAKGQQRCPTGWFQHGTKCYKIFNASTSFYDAIIVCREFFNNSSPVIVRTSDEQTFLYDLINQHSSSKIVWLGARSLNGKTFEWLDQSPLQYNNWDQDEPAFFSGKEYCVIMSLTTHHKGKWINLGCTPTSISPHVVCEKSLSSTGSQPARFEFSTGNEISNSGPDGGNSKVSSKLAERVYSESKGGRSRSIIFIGVFCGLILAVGGAIGGFFLYKRYVITPDISFQRFNTATFA